MRQIMEPVEVRPGAFLWRGQVYPVRQVLETWSYRGRWWSDPSLAGERRTYYRLSAAGGVFELFRRHDGAWFLSRVLD
ncbi:MAG: DUF6504 family protein [Candidatus Eremiobacterota bacterium]